MIAYKQYHIQRFEHGHKRWVARITRSDGQNIRTILPASEHPYLDTKPTASAEEPRSLPRKASTLGVSFKRLLRSSLPLSTRDRRIP